MAFCPHSTLTFVVLMSSFLTMIPAGWQFTVFNNPQKLLEEFVNRSYHAEYGSYLGSTSLTLVWSAIIATLAVGALTGCFLSMPLCIFFGRKYGLFVANCSLLIIGSILSGIAIPANSFECLLVGRLLLGVYTGCAMTILALFISEVSPPEFEGPLSCLLHIGMIFGACLGALVSVNECLGNVDGLPYLLSIPLVFGLMQLLCLPLIVESPKYLHEKSPFSDAAIASASYYNGPNVNPRLVLYRFDEEEAESPAQLSFWAAVSSPVYRKNLLMGALVNFAQIFTGLMAIVSYSTTVLVDLGVPTSLSQYVTAIGGLVGLLFSIPTLYFVEKTGRRLLLVASLGVLTIVNTCLMIFGMLLERSVGGSATQIGFVASAFAFLIAYNIGPGPIAYFISGELAPAPCRTSFLAVGVCVNWFSTMISTLIFYPLDVVIGSVSFIIFVIPTGVATYLLYRYLPETKHKELHGEKEVLGGLADSLEWSTDRSNSSSSHHQKLYGTFDD